MVETVHRTDHDGVAVLTLDCPDRTANVVDERVLGELGDELDRAHADPTVEAIVLASGKAGSFGVGADLAWLPELAARPDAASFLASVHTLMVRIVRADEPFVAAIDGTALGGALELALAGHAIVATPGATLGLPEVGLELLPGGGGTQLLGRHVPTDVAADLLTSGRRIGGEEAHALGLVAELVDPPELVARAVAVARGLVGADVPRDPVHGPGALAALTARREELEGSRAGVTAAAARLLEVVEVGVRDGLEAGLAAEREGFLALLRSPGARAAIHLFAARSAVERRGRAGGPAVATLGIVGAGQMGAGIAATAVARGLTATVRDVDGASLERAEAYRDRVLARTVPDGDDSRARAWSASTGWGPVAGADAVIEAVFELPELKREILGELSARASGTALLATNTSAISIASLATAVDEPGRFLGMHFFSPVERLPLVELIPHAGTSPETTARAASLGRQLGKVPVVVGDAPGFFTSRVYARWLIEGVRLLLDGVPPGDVDAAARDVGFPVGPLQAHDEATLELVLQASITQVADQVLADRLDVAGVRAALEAAVAAGLGGRRAGRGFHRYEDGRRVGPNDEVLAILGVDPAPRPLASVGERLLLAFATECYACWDDGTLCHPDDGDVAAVLGIGFPRALGGPFHWADEVGAADLVRRCEDLGTTAFPPGETLLDIAGGGVRFTDRPRRPAPFEVATAPDRSAGTRRP